MKLSIPAQLLLALCGLHLVINILWLGLNSAPLPWDQAGHTRLAIEMSQFYKGTFTKDIGFLSISSYYPPLTHITTSFLLYFFGPNEDIAAFSITLYFVALLIGIYVLVKQLTKNNWIALTTATFFSVFPPIYENARWFLLDIPLLTMLVYAWIFLIKSKAFTIWKYTSLFILFTVGVFLTKWIGIVFLLIPILFSLLPSIKKGLSKEQVSQLYLSGIITLILIMPWYYTNVHRLIEIGKLASQGEITDPQNLVSLENIRFYFTHILNFQLTLWPALAAIISSIIYFLDKKSPHKLLLSSFFVFGYAFFTFISNKDIRYTLPLLLPLAFILANTLVTSLSNKKYMVAVLNIVTLLWLVFQYFTLSFHLLPSYQRAWNFGSLGWIDYINTTDIVVTHPKTDTSPSKEIISILTTRQQKQPASILVGIDQPDINPSTLDLILAQTNNKVLSFEAPFNRTSFNNEREIELYLSRFQYVIAPTGEVGPDASRHKRALEQIRDYVFYVKPGDYEEITFFKLGDPTGDLRIWRKIK